MICYNKLLFIVSRGYPTGFTHALRNADCCTLNAEAFGWQSCDEMIDSCAIAVHLAAEPRQLSDWPASLTNQLSRPSIDHNFSHVIYWIPRRKAETQYIQLFD
ncbi:hypothetical protein KCU89_g54, partial [Aureobasidium melanogenum]